MGIFDKITDAAGDHADKINQGLDTGIDKAGDAVDHATGGRFAEHVDKAQDLAKTHDDAVVEHILHNEQGAVPPVDGIRHAENPPGEDVLDRLADAPPQG